MRRAPTEINVENIAGSGFDTVIEWLMIALLAFMPLAFGAVQGWSVLVVVTLAGAMFMCLAAKLAIRPDADVVWTWAYVPPALFILLIFVQLSPLPSSLIRMVSPNTVGTKERLLGDLPEAYETLKSMTLSFYPLATRRGLWLVMVVAAVFVTVINVYRTPKQVKRLLGAVAAIGGAIALLALAQNVFCSDKIYWLVPTPNKIANSGPFVNHSHYGQFMNLSIGAALGLSFVKLHDIFRQRNAGLPEVVQRLCEPESRVVWYLAIAIVVGAATIFLSLTRGGMISMLIAGGFTAVITATSRGLRGRSWIIAIMAAAGFICVLYIGFDAVCDRLGTLRDLRQYEGRKQILQDLSVSFTRFPVLGTGLSTHAVVYPMFDRSSVASLAQYAENEYAQTAEETGIVGLALVLTFCAIVWRCYVRNVRTAPRRSIRSAAFGLGFGLLAVMIHSFSDFGQHLPANACLTALTCGLLVVLARRRKNAAQPIAARRGRVRAVGIMAIVCIAPLWAWAVGSATSAAIAESQWQQARRIEDKLSENGWEGTDNEYEALLTHALNALKKEPENVHYRHWYNVYRWRSLIRSTRSETDDIMITPRMVELTRRIVADLHRARVCCPTFGPVYCVAGQLEMTVLKDPQGARNIRRGYKLAPCDPTASYVAGLLDVEEGHPEEALGKFQRSLELSGLFFRDIVRVYTEAGRPDLAVEVAKDNVNRLLYIAKIVQGEDSGRPLAAKARADALAILERESRRADAPAWLLATMAKVIQYEQDYESAIEYYRRALALEYGRVSWRLQLARLLAETGQVPEAVHEARICLRLRPQMRAARKLIEDLSVRPGGLPYE